MVSSVAILGAGIGQQHLLALLELPEHFKVDLVVDASLERANAMARTSGCHVSTEIDKALSDESIDIVDICLPPHLHVPVALAALKAGKHVICEKPIATSLSDLDDIQATALATERRFYPVFQYRWGPSLAALRHLIATGLTGRPLVATVETHWDRGTDYYANPWRGTWAGEQGGAVLGHAIHNHDLLTHIMGPVSAVSAVTDTLVNPIETEDCAAIALELANGAIATSSITLGHATNETRLRFVFERLTATSGPEPYAPGAAPWSFIARNPEQQSLVDEAVKRATPENIGFAGFFEEIAKDLTGKPNTAVSFEDGVQSISLVSAIYQASRTRTQVKLPLSKNTPLYFGWMP